MAKKLKKSDRFVYHFTAEHGPEEFPTLPLETEDGSRRLTKECDVQLDEPVDHPRLVLVSGPYDPNEKAEEEKSGGEEAAPTAEQPVDEQPTQQEEPVNPSPVPDTTEEK